MNIAVVRSLAPEVVIGVGDFSVVVAGLKSTLAVVDVLVEGDTVELLSAKQCSHSQIMHSDTTS